MRKDGSTLVRKLTVGSLFSGIGGIDLGLERAGMRVAWQVENDPFCQRVLRKHWPHVTLHTDVRRKIPFEQVDVIAGGFPCQPVSGSGLRLGEEDPRWLWPQMLAVVKQVRPRWVVIENVEGLRTKGLGSVLEGLAECGYDAEWDRLPASAFGAPHQRRRYFIVAYPGSAGRDSHARILRAHPETGPERQADRPLHAGAPAANSNGNGSLRTGLYEVERKVVLRAAGGSRGGLSAGGTEVTGSDDVDWREYEGAVRRWEAIRGEASPQPLVRRVDDGVPDLVDRLRSLGNAVVPQVAEYVGRRIIEVERELMETA